MIPTSPKPPGDELPPHHASIEALSKLVHTARCAALKEMHDRIVEQVEQAGGYEAIVREYERVKDNYLIQPGDNEDDDDY